MMIMTIIPTIHRHSLNKATTSVTNNRAFAIVKHGGTAGENRNKGLQEAERLKADWVSFLDDDDYYNDDWDLELDGNYDIVIMRMTQGDKIIPDKTDELRFGNVGINFALNMNRIKWQDVPKFDIDGEGEDWRFLEKIIRKYSKSKITKEIFYIAPKRSFNR